MANPTSNFGWQMPTPTDLVTSLPADFEVFGQAVDTSMADLKGGTTGQILAKATNTDMDFTWVTNDVGDITAVTAGTGLTGGGTTGAVSLAFDQVNYGGGQYAAAKNKIINGDFRISQRGSSFSTLNTYCLDRYVLNADAGSMVVSQQTFTPGTAPVAGYEGSNYARIVTTASAANALYLLQKIEDVRVFAGQTMTLSYWAKVSSGTVTNTPLYIQDFGTGGSGAVVAAMSSATLTTSWQRFSHTIAIPSISGKTIGTGSNLALQFLRVNVSATIEMWGIQAEVGSIATPFQTATGTNQGELAACQRYYYRMNSDAGSTFAVFSQGSASSTTSTNLVQVLPVQMRVKPTVLDASTPLATFFNIVDAAGNAQSPTALALDGAQSSASQVFFSATVGAGLTQFRPYVIRGNNNSGAYIGWSAEL